MPSRPRCPGPDRPGLWTLRRPAGRPAGIMDQSALRADPPRRESGCPRRDRRQGAGAHAHHERRGVAGRAWPLAGAAEVPDRGRRGSRQRGPGGLHRRQRHAPGMRLRGHQRRLQIQPRHSRHHLRPAGDRLLRDPRDGAQSRFALGLVRRFGDQSGDDGGADPGRDGRSPRQDPDPRLLRRRGAADRARAAAVRRAALQRGRVLRRDRRRRARLARKAIRPWSGVGRGRPTTFAAFGAATRAKEPRPSCPPRPGPSSAFAWFRTSRRRRSPPRCGAGCRRSRRPA